MSVTETLTKIVSSNWNLYGGDLSRFTFSINGVVERSFIRAGGKPVDLPGKVKEYMVDFTQQRRDDNHWFCNQLHFIKLESGVIIPLGTHASPDRAYYNVYKLKQDGYINQEIPIHNYFLGVLPAEILLTRVLSPSEVTAWNEKKKKLGSSNPPLWEKTVHTAYYSVTDEFCDSKKYSRVINFLVPKEELASAISMDCAAIGTYRYQFRGRREESFFPFDMEVSFERGPGISVLKRGYQRWKKKDKVESLPNPFYTLKR